MLAASVAGFEDVEDVDGASVLSGGCTDGYLDVSGPPVLSTSFCDVSGSFVTTLLC